MQNVSFFPDPKFLPASVLTQDCLCLLYGLRHTCRPISGPVGQRACLSARYMGQPLRSFGKPGSVSRVTTLPLNAAHCILKERLRMDATALLCDDSRLPSPAVIRRPLKLRFDLSTDFL